MTNHTDIRFRQYMMLDDCLASLEETSKSERVCELSENSDTNVSQVHSQVSAKQQPESPRRLV